MTLVHTEGSTYRRPGAHAGGCRMPHGGDDQRRMSGGSGCPGGVGADTRVARAGFVFESTPEDDSWGPASGCHGRLFLLAERIDSRNRHPALEQLALVRESHHPAVRTHTFCRGSDGELCADQTRVVEDAGLQERWPREAAVAFANKASRWVEADGAAAFLEYFPPPVHLLICGAGDDAQPVASIASELAWTVDLVDTRARLATRDRFPTVRNVHVGTTHDLFSGLHSHSAVVLMTHRFVDDLDILAQLFQGEAALPYIGILGPRRRTEHLLAELALRNVAPTARQLKSVHSPVGLDVARTLRKQLRCQSSPKYRPPWRGGTHIRCASGRGRCTGWHLPPRRFCHDVSCCRDHSGCGRIVPDGATEAVAGVSGRIFVAAQARTATWGRVVAGDCGAGGGCGSDKAVVGGIAGGDY